LTLVYVYLSLCQLLCTGGGEPWQPVYYVSAKSHYIVFMGYFVVENPHPPPACRLPW